MSPQNWSDIMRDGENMGLVFFLYVGDRVEIYKKTKGWDNEILWLKFWRKDGIFQWVKSDDDPCDVVNSPEISGVPIVQLEENLYWNFILRDSDPSEEQPLCEKIYAKIFSGEDSVFTCFQLNISWNGHGFLFGINDETFQENVEFTYEFYSNAFPLIELPNSAVVQEPVEGWTCLESSQEEKVYSDSEAKIECLKAENESLKDSISNLCEVHQKEIDLINSKNERVQDDTEEDEDEKRLMEASVNALIDENKSLKEDLEAKNLMIQQLMEDTASEETGSDEEDDYDSYAEEIYQERRIDPFDNEMYTKEEFQDYYGYDGFGDAMWEMNHPDKVSKVLMYEWILSRNEDVLSAKSKNHIMDKMIETLCS